MLIPLSLGIFFSQYFHQEQGTPEGVSATVLPEARALPKFVLKDHHGKQFTNESLNGHWSFIFFGYTQCPDICPITLAILNQVEQLLKKDSHAELPKVIFISVDPDRDTPQALAEYVPYFNADFIGVSGDLESLQVLTKALGIVFGKESDGGSDEYEVFHSARIMLLDPEARLKALFSSPHNANNIAADYLKIIDS